MVVYSKLGRLNNRLNILKIPLGVIFIWFGALKFFPGLSSAEALAGKTVLILSFGYIPPVFSLPLLAFLECLIGLSLLVNRFIPIISFLLCIQLIGTLTPLFLFPELTFAESIFVPTLLGQYILKNLVLLSVAFLIGFDSVRKF